jgi:hypothetical protein
MVSGNDSPITDIMKARTVPSVPRQRKWDSLRPEVKLQI